MIKELLAAVEYGDITKLSQILNAENVNYADEHGFTVAILAARRGDLEMIKLAARYGADFNQKSSSGQTALNWANINNNAEMIDFITQYSGTSKPGLKG